MRDDPLLLVLDEPTAALDAETEHALFERFADAGARRPAPANGRITILVSHRFSTVRMADLIVVLDGARVVEVGTHDELMARGGQYAELYAIQAAPTGNALSRRSVAGLGTRYRTNPPESEPYVRKKLKHYPERTCRDSATFMTAFRRCGAGGSGVPGR